MPWARPRVPARPTWCWGGCGAPASCVPRPMLRCRKAGARRNAGRSTPLWQIREGAERSERSETPRPLLVSHPSPVISVVSTEARRAERRDLLSTIGRLSWGEGLSAPRFALRSRRRNSPKTARRMKCRLSLLCRKLVLDGGVWFFLVGFVLENGFLRLQQLDHLAEFFRPYVT